MVLAELGGKLRESLRKLQQAEDKLDKNAVTTLINEIVRALMEADVNVKLCMKLRNNIQDRVLSSVDDDKNNNSNNQQQQQSNVGKLIQKAVVEELTALVSSPDIKPYKLRRNKPNVILFVGLQGAGKTTSIAKFAQYYSRKGWKVCMVCADTFRAGAFDQLKQNATKLRIPFYGSYAEADPVSIAQRGVDQFIAEHYEVILVDTSGRHRQEGALLEEMQEISNAVNPDDTVFVMDATQGQAIYDQAFAFREAVSVGSVIVTKLDGHAKGGGALSAVAATQSPISFLGSGEHFDDLTPFYAPSFIQQLLGMGGSMAGYMHEMKDLRDHQSQKEMLKKMKKGEFTLRDMYKQFQKTMQMGGMGKMMSGMAGAANMPEYLMPNSDESTRRLKTFLYIMDSMTNAELDGKVDLHNITNPKDLDSRIKRIARGSGTHPKEVQLLLQTHKQMQNFVSKSSKAMKGGAGNARQRQMMQEQFKKNPNAMMQHLNKTNPQLVQQMGGQANMMKMMQQMNGGGPGAGGGGGMPDMATMAQMMQSMGGGLGGGMPGAGGGMPDMASMAKMMQQMGMGGASGGSGGMPDMAQMMKMMQGMR